MSDNTLIEWSDATWNVITGCSMVSGGCKHCYAMRLAATRLRRHPSRKGLTDRNGRWTGEVRFNEQWLDQPLRWRKPRRIFVVAHGDLFHEAVPDEWVDRVFGTMLRADWHVYQILTKRPERMRDYMAGPLSFERARKAAAMHLHEAFRAPESCLHGHWPPRHLWLGTSVEDQRSANERIPLLLETPAAVRWISAEPLLEEVTVFDLDGPIYRDESMEPPVHWVVCGGESGPRARPMDPQWARLLRDQCIIYGVPFFFKQWGGRTSKAAGRLLDGRTWDQMPRQEARG